MFSNSTFFFFYREYLLTVQSAPRERTLRAGFKIEACTKQSCQYLFPVMARHTMAFKNILLTGKKTKSTSLSQPLTKRQRCLVVMTTDSLHWLCNQRLNGTYFQECRRAEAHANDHIWLWSVKYKQSKIKLQIIKRKIEIKNKYKQ